MEIKMALKHNINIYGHLKQFRLNRHFIRYVLSIEHDGEVWYLAAIGTSKNTQTDYRKLDMTQDVREAYCFYQQHRAEVTLEKILEQNKGNNILQKMKPLRVVADFDNLIADTLPKNSEGFSAVADFHTNRVIAWFEPNQIEIPVRFLLNQWLCKQRHVSEDNYLKTVDYTAKEDNHYSQNIYKLNVEKMKRYVQHRDFMKSVKEFYDDGATWGILPEHYDKCDQHIIDNYVEFVIDVPTFGEGDKSVMIRDYRELGDYLIPEEEFPPSLEEIAQPFRKNIGRIKRASKSEESAARRKRKKKE